jgi:hypothetical protein
MSKSTRGVRPRSSDRRWPSAVGAGSGGAESRVEVMFRRVPADRGPSAIPCPPVDEPAVWRRPLACPGVSAGSRRQRRRSPATRSTPWSTSVTWSPASRSERQHDCLTRQHSNSNLLAGWERSCAGRSQSRFFNGTGTAPEKKRAICSSTSNGMKRVAKGDVSVLPRQ